ncbi:MAG TPA: PepSY domain-containing protein [Allosphingosinicella sp.]|jgi:hypothetical protein
MSLRSFGIIVVVALGVAGCSGGDPNCTTEPKSAWMSEAAMQARVTELGYKANVFKVSGNCYEIYGTDKEGRDVEVYFNPVTGEVVKSEIEG